jgi:hypothetical protein
VLNPNALVRVQDELQQIRGEGGTDLGLEDDDTWAVVDNAWHGSHLK